MRKLRSSVVTILAILVLAALVAAASALAAPEAPVSKELLPNGLTLLMQVDHSKPLVGVCIFVNGGSRTEDPKLSGLSHYYEHLIFRGGSARQAELEFRKEMQRIGEESGGYTTNDYTCYGFTSPSANLDEALWRSLDAWLGLKLTQAKVDKERQVIMEEYNQGEDRPDYKVYYQIERLMFRDHPYKRDTIGLKDAILHSSLATFRTFYNDRYVPNQMVLAVVGDFDPQVMRTKIAHGFAPYPRGKESFELGLTEAPQKEFRMGVETMKTPSTWTYLGFHTPPYRSSDSPTLTVIASLLGKGTSSRLYHALKERENLVTDVGADFEVRKDPGIFAISTQMPPANEAKVFGVIRDELTRLASEPVPAAELARVKAQILNDWVFGAQTPFARAERLCLYGIMSDPSIAGLWPNLIESVTAEDIRRVAAATFAPTQASYSVIRPADATAGGPSQGDVMAMVEPWTKAWPTASSGTRTASASKPRKETLPNGITLILNEDHAAPIVAVATFARGGQWIEPEGLSGVSNMSTVLLRRGAGSMNARQISDAAQLIGMLLGSSGGNDYARLDWQAPSRNFEKAWEIYRTVLTQPTFPSQEIEKARQDLIQQVQSMGDRPFELTNLKFAEAIYRKSPYRRSLLGDEASLKKITAADLRKAYHSQFCGANLVVSVSGDLDPDAVLGLARRTLGSIPKGTPATIGGVKDEPAREKNPIFVDKTQEQITYNTGWLGCSVLDPDYPALKAGVSLIGDRLFFKYVYERGVAYRSWFYMNDRVAQGSIQNEMGVSPPNWAASSGGVLEDVTEYVTRPLQEAEVKRSVDKMLTRYYLGAQENDAVAARLGTYEVTGLGYEFAQSYPERLKKLKAAEVQAALRKYLHPGTYTRVAIGKEPGKTASASMAPSH